MLCRHRFYVSLLLGEGVTRGKFAPAGQERPPVLLLRGRDTRFSCGAGMPSSVCLRGWDARQSCSCRAGAPARAALAGQGGPPVCA
jgi:hypothetical protein